MSFEDSRSLVMCLRVSDIVMLTSASSHASSSRASVGDVFSPTTLLASGIASSTSTAPGYLTIFYIQLQTEKMEAPILTSSSPSSTYTPTALTVKESFL